MAIRQHGVSAVTVGDLLDPNQHDLRIPPYQRPYSWQPATSLQLVDDIRDSTRAIRTVRHPVRAGRGHPARGRRRQGAST